MASIVVIDDDRDFQHLLKLHLTAVGHEVRTFAAASEALPGILHAIPDLVLLDIGLPRMNGYELLNLLRQNPQTSAIPVLLLTGMVDDDSRARGLRLGAAALLEKPVQRDALLKAIDDALRGTKKAPVKGRD